MNHSTSKGTGKSDLRIVKTKRAIMNALTDLLKAKSIGKITVTELAQRAEIKKGTFYLHYQDIYDLYEEALQHYLESVIDGMDFFSLFSVDPDRFARELAGCIMKYGAQDDPFLGAQNAAFNKRVPVYLCSAVVKKILETNRIPETGEARTKLMALVAGAGFVFHYQMEDKEAVIRGIASAIRDGFLN